MRPMSRCAAGYWNWAAPPSTANIAPPKYLHCYGGALRSMLHDMGLRYLIGCSSLNSKDPAEGWQMYRQLERIEFRRSLRRCRPRLTHVPSSRRARPLQPIIAARGIVWSNALRSRFPSSQDLSRNRGADCGAAGMGPRIRHDRFSDSARSQDAVACCAQPLSGAADAVRLRAFRRAVALVFALAVAFFGYWAACASGGPSRRDAARQWLHGPPAGYYAAFGIRTRVQGSRRRGDWWFPTISAISTS